MGQIVATFNSGSLAGHVFYTSQPSTADTTPDQFAFTDQTGVAPNTLIESNIITIQGITADATASISGGEFAVDIGSGFGSYRTSSTTVPNGAQIKVRQTSSGSFSTSTTATLTVGGVSDGFTLTTEAGDTTPDSFAFADQIGAPLNTIVTSNAITISGINDPAPISIVGETGSTYSINGGAATSASGTISDGDTVAVTLPTASTHSTQTNATLTIGGVSDTFSATTLASSATLTLADAAVTISENLGVDSEVTTMTASISSGITYSIEDGNTDSDFAIDEDTGKVTVANNLNHWRTETYTLTVKATDGTAAVTATLTITVVAVQASEIIRDALQEILVQDAEQPLNGSETQTALRYLNRLVKSWPIDLGYQTIDDPSDGVTVPDYAVHAIVLNLAMALATQFDVQPTAWLTENARDAYQNLLVHAQTLEEAQYSDNIPLGSGNRYPGYRFRNFYTVDDGDS